MKPDETFLERRHVENLWLDELHGMRISMRGHDGKWPISTINSSRAPKSHRGSFVLIDDRVFIPHAGS
jgi:hypothetical protein